MRRPSNHVTRGQEGFKLPATDIATPFVPEDLVVYLERHYKPVMFSGGDERALQDYLIYAGNVALVEYLRSLVERQKTPGLGAGTLLDGEED